MKIKVCWSSNKNAMYELHQAFFGMGLVSSSNSAGSEKWKEQAAWWIFKTLHSHYSSLCKCRVKCCGGYLYSQQAVIGFGCCLEWADSPGWPITAKGGVNGGGWGGMEQLCERRVTGSNPREKKNPTWKKKYFEISCFVYGKYEKNLLWFDLKFLKCCPMICQEPSNAMFHPCFTNKYKHKLRQGLELWATKCEAVGCQRSCHFNSLFTFQKLTWWSFAYFGKDRKNAISDMRGLNGVKSFAGWLRHGVRSRDIQREHSIQLLPHCIEYCENEVVQACHLNASRHQ